MGSNYAETGRDEDEGPQKVVELSAFWMGAYEVTFEEWDAFFKNMDVPQTKAIAVDSVSRPTAQYIDLTWGMGRDGNQPTNSMSQAATIMYCKWLYNQTGVFYRLPTEAEWEYACRAGTTTEYFFGATPAKLGEFAWFEKNSGGKPRPVGQKKPNPWGLFDMCGNVWEWCNDFYQVDYYKESPKENPRGPKSGQTKVLRGGAFRFSNDNCRSGYRYNENPGYADVCFGYDIYGFRCVRKAEAKEGAANR